MIEKIHTLWPEISLLVAACVVMVIGLSPNRAVRRLTAPIAGLGLLAAALLAVLMPDPGVLRTPLPNLSLYGKVLTAAVGVMLLLLVVGTTDRDYEAGVARGERFDPLRATSAEFYAFFLFSLMGLMLCAGADDLIWLFLALELTSLPTYVMVSISTTRDRSMEAGVKYFFLGAMGAAVFLFGFTLLYGATGATRLIDIQSALAAQAAQGGLNPIALAGLVAALVGVCFKIAAVPMHFYTPDVYEGSSASVAGFLAFVPKAAGFFAILLLCSTAGWHHGVGNIHLPPPVEGALWIIAALTMTVGNVLALLQTSVKRILAYSSIAHSGYMLVGVIAGPDTSEGTQVFARNGVAAVLFYLLTYGVMTIGAFAAIACLDRSAADGHDEADHIADVRGLCATHPVVGWVLVFSSVGLLGLPLTVGFFAKLPLFSAGIAWGQLPLVIILGLNSAIAAWYYLGLARAALLEPADEARQRAITLHPSSGPRVVAGLLSAAGVLVLAVVGGPLAQVSQDAAGYVGPRRGVVVTPRDRGVPRTDAGRVGGQGEAPGEP